MHVSIKYFKIQDVFICVNLDKIIEINQYKT